MSSENGPFVPFSSFAYIDAQMWSFDIGKTAQTAIFSVPSAVRCLSSGELARASHFRQSDRARRFIAFHIMKRLLLGAHIQCDPAKLPFCWLPSGAPILRDGCNDWPKISLSHSGDVGFMALAEKGNIGVDVERLRVVKNMSALAQKYFGEAAVAELAALEQGNECRRDIFFRYWTLREARFKCSGTYAENYDEQVTNWKHNGYAYAVVELKKDLQTTP
jgi:phosphopantetheinyl transferase